MKDDEPILRDDEDFNEEDLQFDENEDFFPQNYDLEKVFDEMIHPLLKTVVNICKEYSIPMVTTFQYKNTESQIMLCTSIVVPPKRTCEKIQNAVKTLLE